uniref:Uncharacterized protein n=1 Tax=Arundo donax TaxID=35708 RepID=A0A0A9ETE1_ARUDO
MKVPLITAGYYKLQILPDLHHFNLENTVRYLQASRYVSTIRSETKFAYLKN